MEDVLDRIMEFIDNQLSEEINANELYHAICRNLTRKFYD